MNNFNFFLKIVALLEEEYPKLKTLQGGWMFFKSTGRISLNLQLRKKYT